MLTYLLGLQACEAEHPNLVGDVLPVVRGALLFQSGHQLLPHRNDAFGHRIHLLQPTVHTKQLKALKK